MSLAINAIFPAISTAQVASTVATVDVDASNGPIFRTLHVELGSPGPVEVVYWREGAAPLLVRSETEAARHSVFLPRLRQETNYEFEVRTPQQRGGRLLEHGRFRTDALPTGLDQLRFVPSGQSTYPLTMLELQAPDLFFGFVVVDGDGEVVWYWQTEGQPTGFTRRANGNFVFIEWSVGLTEVTPDRRVAFYLPEPGVHHDVVSTPRDTLLFLSDEYRNVAGEDWLGDAIWEWDPGAGRLEKRWSVFDFLSTETDRTPISRLAEGWVHSNSLSLGPRGNVLVSMRRLHQVLSIAPDFQSLEWRLGGPGSSYSLSKSDEFWGQHTASEIEPNHILLFDNGYARESGELYSRALEIQIDPGSGRAWSVWEYRPTPDIYASFVSSAFRLANGNSFVTFGPAVRMIDSSGPVAVHEVDAAGNISWELRMSPTIQIVYRGSPLANISGERPVLCET